MISKLLLLLILISISFQTRHLREVFSVCMSSGFSPGRNQFTGSWPVLIFNAKEYNRKYPEYIILNPDEWISEQVYICINIQGQDVKWNSNKNAEYHCYVFFFLGDDRLLLPQEKKASYKHAFILGIFPFHNILSTLTPIIFLYLSVKNSLLYFDLKNFYF